MRHGADIEIIIVSTNTQPCFQFFHLLYDTLILTSRHACWLQFWWLKMLLSTFLSASSISAQIVVVSQSTQSLFVSRSSLHCFLLSSSSASSSFYHYLSKAARRHQLQPKVTKQVTRNHTHNSQNQEVTDVEYEVL